MREKTLVKETDNWAEYMENLYGSPQITRYKKHPCVGGPFDGQRHTAVTVASHRGYVQYNRGASAWVRKDRDPPKMVWLWFGDL